MYENIGALIDYIPIRPQSKEGFSCYHCQVDGDALSVFYEAKLNKGDVVAKTVLAPLNLLFGEVLQ